MLDVFAIFLSLIVTPAHAQCIGLFGSGTVCGNPSGTASGAPGPMGASQILPELPFDIRISNPSLVCSGGTDASATIAAAITAGHTVIFLPAGCSYQPPTTSGSEVVPPALTIVGDPTNLATGNLTLANVSVVTTASRTTTTDHLKMDNGSGLRNVAVISYDCDNLNGTLITKFCPIGQIGEFNNSDAVQNAVAYPWENTFFQGANNVSGGLGRTQKAGTFAAQSATGTTITFASALPINVGVGQTVLDLTTGGNIPANTTVSSLSGGNTVVHLNNSTTVATNDSIQFSSALSDMPLLNIEQSSNGDGIFCATNAPSATCLNLETNSSTSGDTAIFITDGVNFPAVAHIGIRCKEYQTAYNSVGCITLERPNGGTVPLIVFSDDGPTTWGGSANQQPFAIGLNYWSAGPVMQFFQSTTASSGDFIQLNAGNSGGTFTGNFLNFSNGGTTEFKVNSSGVVTANGEITAPGLTATAVAATVAAGQIGYGSTTTANTNCGTLAGSAGCVVINVAGTTHYIPYY